MNSDKMLNVLLLAHAQFGQGLQFDADGAHIHVVHVVVDGEDSVRETLREGWDIVLCDTALLASGARCIPDLATTRCNGGPPLFLFFDGERETAGARSEFRSPRPPPQSGCGVSSACAREKCGHVRQLLHFDQLTGLPNGAFLSEVVRHATDGPRLFHHLVLLVINIRRFSLVRQTLDKEAGNQILRMIGTRLREAVGQDGLVARLGGDQYAVLLLQHGQGIDPADVAARINTCLAPPFQVADDELFFTHHVGISVFPRDGEDYERLEANAELAMKFTGRQGQNSFSFYSPPMQARARNRISLEHALCRAIRNDGFELFYQPQYDIVSHRMVGAEALLRLHPSAGGVYSPAEFVPVLEDSGLIVAVGEWALRTACLRNRAWQRAGHAPVRVAVNLSAVQLEESDLVQTVQRVLRETELAPEYLELEITESVAMLDETRVTATLAALRDLGVILTIDDFGKGYSSLSYLLRFPVHRLKIDRAFVHAITQTEAAGYPQTGEGALLGGIIALARGIGVGVLAEGVETPAQAAFLARSGCREMQGFLFSRPAPESVMPGLFGQLGPQWMHERLAGSVSEPAPGNTEDRPIPEWRI